MQMAPAAMGRGLGKFGLQLVELMARQLGMELVMIYLKDGKVTTMRLNKSHRKLTERQPAAGGGFVGAPGLTPDEFELVPHPEPVMMQQGRPVAVRCC